MKTILLIVVLICSFFCNAQTVYLPNVNLKTALLNHQPSIDLNSNGEIEISEALAVTEELILNDKSINNIIGLTAFSNVKKINLADNNLVAIISNPINFNSFTLLEDLNLHNNPEIKAVNCNQLSTMKRLYLGRDVINLELNQQSQLLDLRCNEDIFQSLSSLNKSAVQKLSIYIIENSYPNLLLGTLNSLTDLYLESYESGVYLNVFTGNFPNLYSIYFHNITILSSTSLELLSNIREFTLSGAGGYDYLYNKIYSFTNLKNLILNSNQSFSPNFPNNKLDFSSNVQLEELFVSLSASTGSYQPINLSSNIYLKKLTLLNYGATSISLTNNINLENLYLTSTLGSVPLDLTSNINLKQVHLSAITMPLPNNYYTLNLSQNTALEEFWISDGPLENINFGSINNVKKLEIKLSNLENINLSSFSSLINFELNSTKDILEIDLTNSHNLDTVVIKLATSEGNNVHSSNFIKLKNNSTESSVKIQKYNSDLKLCIDETDTTSNWILTGDSSTNYFSTYCAFNPGGLYNKISGKIRLDLDVNGCSATDATVTNVKVLIDDSVNSGYTFTNLNGDYEFFTASDTVTITPEPNINYFTASPISASINFDNQFQEQDFCVVPLGVHNDLEINLLPITAARPGFDAKYKIVYRNNGNQVQSGIINLLFEDSVLDFVSANPIVASPVTDLLTWNFSNLLPFESREIDVVFNLNSPLETPSLNSGDILNYTSSILGLVDENSQDNEAVLNQAIVNSFDPNDKICVEGLSISPTTVGNYVHYIVRFENTGTFAAETIVVKDIIDESKFDINSLMPVSASHPFKVRATNNIVEFLFDTINLPFDDANNDGYIAFKIKTKSTLALGDTFSNSAEIYFDHNYPIVTNTYTTSVGDVLATKNYQLTKLVLYPNPVRDVLNFTTNETVLKTEVYDVSGRKLTFTISENKLDLSHLNSGSYIIKIYTESGIKTTTIVKE